MWSYKEALKYVDSFVNYEKKEWIPYKKKFFDLRKMRYLLSLVGNPHQHLRTIHIAGTKGKGSTAAIIASILKRGGLKVGLYTSPHLISPRERIRVGDDLIKKEEFAYFLSQIKSRLKTSSYQIPFTFFEIYTALAFLYFFNQKVDLAILEVGLGGRLDATNVIYPLVAVITQISFDHTRELGKELVAIAKEKAGIIKKGSTVITSPQDTSVMEVIEQVAREKKARLYKVGKDIRFKRIESNLYNQTFRVETTKQGYNHLYLSLAGRHQLINAATAIGAIDLLERYGVFTPPEAVVQGLKKVKWPGRIQILSTKPLLLVDCAHNEASAKALAKYLKETFPEKGIVLILSILKNKDVEGIGRALCPLADRIILTKVNSPRALEPLDLKRKIEKFCEARKIMIKKKISNAAFYARSLASSEDLICVTGSVYLAGETLKYYQKKGGSLCLEE